jgi:rare lipoprotein A
MRPALIALAGLLLLGSPAHARQPRKPLPRPQQGVASYYADFHHGKLQANGRPFNMHARTFASRTLPLGTVARVRNLDNGRVAIATCEDRGPYVAGRKFDMSKGMATRLGFVQQGTARLRVTPIAIRRR